MRDCTKVLEKAINTYGEEAQTDMMIEEMSELTKALLKNRRNESRKTRADIIEEMADVQIMLDQMKIIYDADDELGNYREDKLVRLAARLGIAEETAEGGLAPAT